MYLAVWPTKGQLREFSRWVHETVSRNLGIVEKGSISLLVNERGQGTTWISELERLSPRVMRWQQFSYFFIDSKIPVYILMVWDQFGEKLNILLKWMLFFFNHVYDFFVFSELFVISSYVFVSDNLRQDPAIKSGTTRYSYSIFFFLLRSKNWVGKFSWEVSWSKLECIF